MNKIPLFVILIFCIFITDNTFSLENKFAVVTTESGLNIRKEPSKSSNSLGLIPFGNFIIILSKSNKNETIDGKRGTWCKVKWNSIEGYVFDAFLRYAFAYARIIHKMPNISNSVYSGGIDCSGSTGSEYEELLEFKNDDIIYTNQGAGSIDCKLKDPNAIVGYSAYYVTNKFGKYKFLNDYILITFNRSVTKITPSDQCMNAKKTECSQIINENYKVYPIICESDSNKKVEGFIIPGFGVYSHAIWVKRKLN